LLVENEQYLRGDAAFRTAKTAEVNAYFKHEFSEVLTSGELPLRLLDGKKAIKDFRRYVSETHQLSFGDPDIISKFTRAEVPQEIANIVTKILEMFPVVNTAQTVGSNASARSTVVAGELFD